MNRELKRIILDKKIIFIIIFVVFLLFATSIYYTCSSKKTDIQFSHDIAVYKNDSDIDDAIAYLKTELANLNINDKDYRASAQRINENIFIYEYVKTNHISYDDCQEVIALEGKNNTRIDYLIYSTTVIVFSIILVSFILGYSLFVSDQQNRYSVFLYGTEKKRMYFILKKITLFFIVILCVTVLLFTLSLIMSMALESPHQTLLYVYNDKVFVMGVNTYVLKNILSLFFYTLCVGLMTVTVGLVAKKQFLYVIGLIGIIAIMFISGLVNNEIMQSLFIYPMSIYTFDIRESLFIGISASKFTIIVILLLLSINYFNKKDLV